MSAIPTYLTAQQFAQYVDPSLSRARRGFVGHIPRHKVFNYILYWLHTGCQWDELPIAPLAGSEKKSAVGKPFTTISVSGVETAVSNAFGMPVSYLSGTI